jgi:uncharacterized protein (DUF1810 family)
MKLWPAMPPVHGGTVESNRVLGGLGCRAVTSGGANAEANMPDSSDPYLLSRFVLAQQDDYDQALSEIVSGRKRSHWMWYIFPQFDGLAFSSTSKHFAIKSLDEARAYIDHPVLGPRLRECAEAVVRLEGRTAREIFGSPDDLKLRSCATLFACVSPPGSVFERLLEKYYQGRRDGKTLQLLGIGPSPGAADDGPPV